MTTTIAAERGKDGLAGLMAEAERRIRGGETQSAVAAALQVPPSTLWRWAARGRFRLKDLVREELGLAPLPLPPSAAPGCGQSAGSRPRGYRAIYAEEVRRAEAGELDLAGEAAGLARQALALVRAGRPKAADEKLRAADRMLRIHRRLGESPAAPISPAQQERARILGLSETELRAEIAKLAGLAVSTGPAPARR